MCDRVTYTFRGCMWSAWHDIRRVAKHWRNCNLKHEAKCIILEIKHGIFDQGK